MARILVTDDEAGIREFIAEALAMEGHDVTRAADGQEAWQLLCAKSFAVLLTDLKMPNMGGMELLRKVRAEQPDVEVIVLTAHGTVGTAIEAMRLGAFEYLQKPISGPDELTMLVGRALEHRGLLRAKETADLAEEAGIELGFGDPAMKPVIEAIRKVARTAATVLLLGESGAGKEVAARAVHQMSGRRDKPFVAVNCAALTENLLESELFGHEKGAFTGAAERRRGKIELADGGTFFLDEVAELKPELQAKLLRVLQERNFERVGGTQSIEADVRWIAATNRDLPANIGQGRFREDLYHRLAVFPIRLPALRDRPADILPLAGELLGKICKDLKRSKLDISRAAAAKLTAWHWPGNVRELANSLERAAILTDGDTIEPDHLWLESSSEIAPVPQSSGAIQSLADVEKQAIERALAATDGNRRKAAELLGIGERTLYDKIKRYGLS